MEIVRRVEFDALVTSLHSAARGNSGIVDLCGEPGSGKTYLLSRLLAEAEEHGFTVHGKRCAEPEADTPFSAMASTMHALGVEWQSDQGGNARALAQRIVEGCASAGTVILLDDVHWADHASVEVLGHLVRNLPARTPLLLVIARRPRQTQAQLYGVLAQRPGRRQVQRIPLDALSVDQAAELLGACPADSMTQELHRRSTGNPLFLLALSHEVNPAGGERAREQLDVLLNDEITPLPPARRAVIDAAAVLGDGTDIDTLATVAELSPEDTCAAVDELARRDLVRQNDKDHTLALRHAVLRGVVYGSTGPGWRHQAHRRALRALASRGASPAEQARHIEMAPAGHNPDDVRVLSEAAEQTAADDPATATRWLQLAARIVLTDGHPQHDNADQVLHLANCLVTLGEARDSLALLHNVLARPGAEPSATRTALVAMSGMVGSFLGDHAGANKLIAQEMDRCAGAAARVEAAKLVVVRGMIDLFSGMLPDQGQAKWAHRVLAGHEDRMATIGAQALVAMTLASAGEFCRAELKLAACARSLSKLTDEELERHPEHFVLLGWAEALLCRFNHAERYFNWGITIARRLRRAYLLPSLLVGASNAYRNTGRLADALAATTEAAAIAERCRAEQIHGLAMMLESLSLVWTTSDGAPAVRLADRAMRTLPPGAHAWSVNATLGHAFVTWMAGDARRCVALLLAVGGGDDLPSLPRALRPACYELLTACAVEIGDPRASYWAAHATTEAERSRRSIPLAQAYGAQAHVARSASAFTTAVRLYRQVADLYATAGMRCAKADALRLAASCAITADDRETAEALLFEAADLAERCGATRILEDIVRLRHELDGMPSTPAHQTAPALGGDLTGREQEIAEIAATGMRSREIAELLGLSTRTVDVHLSRIYRKLGINGRTALVRLMAGAGVTTR